MTIIILSSTLNTELRELIFQSAQMGSSLSSHTFISSTNHWFHAMSPTHETHARLASNFINILWYARTNKINTQCSEWKTVFVCDFFSLVVTLLLWLLQSRCERHTYTLEACYLPCVGCFFFSILIVLCNKSEHAHMEGRSRRIHLNQQKYSNLLRKGTEKFVNNSSFLCRSLFSTASSLLNFMRGFLPNATSHEVHMSL